MQQVYPIWVVLKLLFRKTVIFKTKLVQHTSVRRWVRLNRCIIYFAIITPRRFVLEIVWYVSPGTTNVHTYNIVELITGETRWHAVVFNHVRMSDLSLKPSVPFISYLCNCHDRSIL